MKVIKTRLNGPVLLEPDLFHDQRGFFQETYRQASLFDIGISDNFVQDNHSRSSKGVVRGMHFQIGEGIAKLVRCARGSIIDVVVDLRLDSPTFAEWESFELNDENGRQVYCPVGFAHGFCVLSEVADVLYKQSGYYSPELERGIYYKDPKVNILWPEGLNLIPSKRDQESPLLEDVKDELNFSL